MKQKETAAWFAGWLTSTCEQATSDMEVAIALIDNDPEAAKAFLSRAVKRIRKNVEEGREQAAI